MGRQLELTAFSLIIQDTYVVKPIMHNNKLVINGKILFYFELKSMISHCADKDFRHAL